MKNTKIQDIILSDLKSIKQNIEEIRQKDIPNIKVEIAVVKSETKNSAKIITGVGGLIAVLTSIAIAYFK